jgi:hypothetical protein
MHKPKTLYIKGVRQLDSAKALATFDIDLKKLSTNEGELLHIYSRKTTSGVEFEDDRSYQTLNAQLKEAIQQMAINIHHAECKEKFERRARELQQSIETSILEGTSASISLRMLRKKNGSGNHKPLTFKDRATENDETMLKELSELCWLDSTYTEQVRKALNFLNEQESYWAGRSYFDEQEHASKFFNKSPQTSPRVCPKSALNSSEVSPEFRPQNYSLSSLVNGTKRVPTLRLNSTAPLPEQSSARALAASSPPDRQSGSKSSRLVRSPRFLSADTTINKGVSQALFWLHRVSATASSRVTGNRVISGNLREEHSQLKSTSPKTITTSISGKIQTPREQLTGCRGLASYLSNNYGIDLSPRHRAQQSVCSSCEAKTISETAQGSSTAEIVGLHPRPPTGINITNQGCSPLQQLRHPLCKN